MTTVTPTTLRLDGWFFNSIPSHWHVVPLKHICEKSALYGANIPAEDYVPEGVRFLRTTDIRDDGQLEAGGVFVSEEAAEDYLLDDGDLLISRSGTVGRSYAHRTANGKCAYAGYLVRFVVRNDQHPAFVFYLTKSSHFQNWLGASAIESTIGNVNGEKYGNLLIPVPPLTEQRAIAGYLDRETGRLDALVAAKERWLELLAEKRRALITRAVTRGLNPAAPLRDSGLPWLGQIPAHWQTKQLKFACNGIQTGGTPSLDYMDSADEKTVNWFTPADFNESLELRESSRKISAESIAADEAPLFPAGTAYVVGIGATLGKIGYCIEQASANQQVNALLPRPETDSRFLAFMVSTLGELMQALANSATLPILNQQRMGEMSVPVPPLDEQRAIVAHISAETAKLDALRAAAERTIGLLKERRAALIAAAVTGKIEL